MSQFWRFNVGQIKEHGAQLFEALRRHRFAILRLDEASVLQLDKAVHLFAQQKTFRFPPHDERAQVTLADGNTATSTKASQEPNFLYTDLEADCFNTLYSLCRDCLLSIQPLLPTTLPDPPQGPVVGPPSRLPFTEGFQATNPYRASFFNMFNYDHGSLNRHFDRGLLTINYGVPSPTSLSDTVPPRSQLWLRSYSTTDDNSSNDQEQWISADQLLIDDPKHEALLLVGEQLEQASNGVLRAGEHSVRVDPNGERLAYSHQRRDPAATLGYNRLSTAMIFSAFSSSD